MTKNLKMRRRPLNGDADGSPMEDMSRYLHALKDEKRRGDLSAVDGTKSRGILWQLQNKQSTNGLWAENFLRSLKSFIRFQFATQTLQQNTG